MLQEQQILYILLSVLLLNFSCFSTRQLCKCISIVEKAFGFKPIKIILYLYNNLVGM
jgi:hypothetical protein